VRQASYLRGGPESADVTTTRHLIGAAENPILLRIGKSLYLVTRDNLEDPIMLLD
jgi:hypothetical protein